MDNLREIKSFRGNILLHMDYPCRLLKHSATLRCLMDWGSLGYVAMDSANRFSQRNQITYSISVIRVSFTQRCTCVIFFNSFCNLAVQLLDILPDSQEKEGLNRALLQCTHKILK